MALHQLTGATVLYTQYQSPTDANYYDDNAFKQQLDELITRTKPKLLLDLHGSHPYRPYDVDLGSMGGRSLLNNAALKTKLIASLKNEGLFNISEDYFAAEKNQTITKFASARGVAAMQLEISSTWLTPAVGDLNAHRFAQLLQGLARFIQQSHDKGKLSLNTSNINLPH